MGRTAIVLGFIAVAWLVAGRHLTLLLDHVIKVGPRSLATAPLQYDGGGFRIGDELMTFGGIDNLRYPLQISRDANNRLVVSSNGRAIALGPCSNPADPAGRPDIAFTAEPGDRVSFTSSTSVLGWPTPFDVHILSPRSPWWKRYVYYRLVWEKFKGGRLEMIWRHEQQYFRGTGWTTPAMMWNSQTGLLSVKMSEAL
jgi:hypothetical protein